MMMKKRTFGPHSSWLFFAGCSHQLTLIPQGGRKGEGAANESSKVVNITLRGKIYAGRYVFGDSVWHLLGRGRASVRVEMNAPTDNGIAKVLVFIVTPP